MLQGLPKKKEKPPWGSDMSDFVLWFCERGYCKKASQDPKAPLGQEGGLAVATDPAPLWPLPHKKMPLSDGAAKAGPGWAARGPKGPSAMSLKEFPVSEDVVLPRKVFNTLPKSAGFRDGSLKARFALLEDAAEGAKSNPALESVSRVLGNRTSHLPGSQDAQLATVPKTAAKEAPQASHVKAKGDSTGVAVKEPVSPLKLGNMLRRTKKAPRQALKDGGASPRTMNGVRIQHECQILALQGPTSPPAHGVMEVKKKSMLRPSRSNCLNLAGLHPGDLVEIFRFGYQHWAIYIGDGYVIHLAPPSEFAGAGCASLMSTLTDKALVKKELLVAVVGKNRYRVNNKHDPKFPPLPIPKIIRRAEEMVGQELEYKVTSENCEHFVTELRYGVPKSDQVRDALVVAGVAGLGLAAIGIIGTVMKKKKQQNQ